MLKNKSNGVELNQLHTYIEKGKYKEVKDTIAKYNKATYDKTNISELVRFLLAGFINDYNSNENFKYDFLEELREFRNNSDGGA